MRFLLLLVALSTPAALAAEPPRTVAGTLPAWFPIEGVFKTSKGWVHAYDYGESDFKVARAGHPHEVDKVVVRGRNWIANLDAVDRKNWKQQAFAKWKTVESKLVSEGFRQVWRDQSPDHVNATYRRGDGAHATWLGVHIDVDPGGSQMRAIQIASNPLVIGIRPPSAVPETFTDKDDFPYLPPPPRDTLDRSSHYDTPMNYEQPPKCEYMPVGSGGINKYYQVDETISQLEFHDAYVAALTKAGWTIGCHVPNQGIVFAHYERNGRDIYARVAWPDHLAVTDVGASLSAALQRGCKAALYGINFDFDKATLRPDSEPVLEQVLKLLKGEPQLSLEIGGHTDNVGKPDYNLGLSGRRAAAVRDWLVAHGIQASRLTSHGYGDTQPVVRNDSDENRARNRRVELKKPGCK